MGVGGIMGSLIERKKKIMMMQGQGLLPTEYRKIEYLKSTGTQWIVTDIRTSTSVETKYEIIIGYWEQQNTRQLMGADFGAFFGVNSNTTYEYGANTTADGSTDGYDNISFEQEIANGKQVLTVNGITFKRNYRNWKSYPITIFSLNGSYNSNCRIKKFTVKQGGETVGDFIPCVRKSDSKPGMYDTVSQTFYTNAGTGEFIVPQ